MPERRRQLRRRLLPPSLRGSNCRNGYSGACFSFPECVYSIQFGSPRTNSATRWSMKGKKMTPLVWLLLLTVILGVGEVLSFAVRAIAHTP